jgi:hypothetical protein
MSRKKISTTIYVTPEQSDRLKLLHERTKVPVAVYIREGIDLVLRHYAHLLPGQLPLDTSHGLQPSLPTNGARSDSSLLDDPLGSPSLGGQSGSQAHAAHAAHQAHQASGKK